MKKNILIGSSLIGIFIIILLIFLGWLLYQAMGPGTLIIGHLTLAMFLICSAGIFVMIASNIKEIIQV